MSELEILYPQIPFNAVTIDEYPTSNASYPKHNITTGSRSLISKISTPGAAITNKWYQFDLGLGESDTANFLAIARADLLRGNGCTSAFIRPSTVSRNLITDLGLSSLKLWLDADKEVTVNSTRQVSAWGDQSGNSYDFTQSTSANKPVLSRADNKENLFLYSEQFDNGWWSLGAASITANQALSPLSNDQTADQWTEDGTAGNHRVFSTFVTCYSGVSYRVSIYVKANGRTAFELYLGGAAFGAGIGASFDLSTLITNNVSGTSDRTITLIGNGWYRCSFVGTATATGNARFDLYAKDGTGATNYTGNSTSGFYLFGAQLTESAADTTYLATTDHAQYRGINGYPALVFDDTDDVMTSTATLSNVITNSAHTIFLVGRYYNAGSSNVTTFKDSGSYLTVEEFTDYFGLRNYDGTSDIASTSAQTFPNTFIIEARHESGNIYIKLNNGTEGSAASGNTSNLTGTLVLGDTNGIAAKISELLVFNAALTSSQRSQIYTYLATKYTTAAAGSIDIESGTLYGPHDQDMITTFSATTASRYYWLDLHCAVPATTCLFPLSKCYLGTRYDFDDTDPIYPYSSNYRKSARGFTADAGTMFRSREGREQLEYEFNWFINDSTRDDFMTKIGKYYDINPIMLYTSDSSFDAPLNGHTLLHGWIDEIDITGQGPVRNQNRIKLKVVQDV